jgi:hypothetical protein
MENSTMPEKIEKLFPARDARRFSLIESRLIFTEYAGVHQYPVNLQDK